MRCFTKFVILTGVSLLVGCATQAPATSPGASADHAGTTAQTQPASLNSQSASTASKKDDDLTSGYDRVIVQGQELFCRREAVPGTRVTNKVCHTRAELEAAQEAAKQYIDSAQRSSGAMGNGQPANMPAGPY